MTFRTEPARSSLAVQLVILSASALLAALALGPDGEQAMDEVRTQRLVLVDGDGRERLVAAVSEAGVTEVRLLGADGRATHRIGHDAEGQAQLELLLGDGEVGVELRALEGGGGELATRSEGEEGPAGGFRLGMDAAGHGALELLNGAGQRVLFAGATPGGDGALRTDNADANRAYVMGDDPRGNGVVPEDALPGRRLR